jgi:hypothetical protein
MEAQKDSLKLERLPPSAGSRFHLYRRGEFIVDIPNCVNVLAKDPQRSINLTKFWEKLELLFRMDLAERGQQRTRFKCLCKTKEEFQDVFVGSHEDDQAHAAPKATDPPQLPLQPASPGHASRLTELVFHHFQFSRLTVTYAVFVLCRRFYALQMYHSMFAAFRNWCLSVHVPFE